jgi:hypothetical protein
MRLILALALVAIPAGTAHGQCTQTEATAKMQSILTSPRYREVISQTGTHEAPDAGRTATKDVLRTFGGPLGGIGAGIMQDKDTADARNAIHSSASRTKMITTSIADAGAALGRGDYATACMLYDMVRTDLGIQ